MGTLPNLITTLEKKANFHKFQEQTQNTWKNIKQGDFKYRLLMATMHNGMVQEGAKPTYMLEENVAAVFGVPVYFDPTDWDRKEQTVHGTAFINMFTEKIVFGVIEHSIPSLIEGERASRILWFKDTNEYTPSIYKMMLDQSEKYQNGLKLTDPNALTKLDHDVIYLCVTQVNKLPYFIEAYQRRQEEWCKLLTNES